jgi:outer membrane protein
MRLRQLLLLFLLVSVPTLVRAQANPAIAPSDGPLELSIEEVVVRVLQNNRELKVQRLTPVIAGTIEQIERGAFDPELFASFEYNEASASEVSRSTSDQFDVESDATTATLGLRQTLSTGTTFEATLEQSRDISNRAPEQQVARAGLTVTQALLRGFGPAVNLVAVQQAELGTTDSRFELRGFAEALLAEAETAYWNLVLAREQIAIYESSLAIARQQRDETELRIEVGLLPEVEAAAARAEVARREQALIDARSLLEERRLRLLRLLNPATGNGYDQQLVATSEARMEPLPLQDLAERLQLAEKLRPDLNAARTQLEQYALETVVTRNGLLPRLDFFITLGKSGYADSFSDSLQNLDGNGYDVTAGLRLSQPLGNRAAKARQLAAGTTRQQGREAVANLQQLVELDVRLAANELERDRQQIAATRVTRELQEATLAAEQERFKVGSSTTLLVSQAQRDLLASQIAEIEAIINYRIALVSLYLSEGSLLERRGARLDD